MIKVNLVHIDGTGLPAVGKPPETLYFNVEPEMDAKVAKIEQKHPDSHICAKNVTSGRNKGVHIYYFQDQDESDYFSTASLTELDQAESAVLQLVNFVHQYYT